MYPMYCVADQLVRHLATGCSVVKLGGPGDREPRDRGTRGQGTLNITKGSSGVQTV